VLVVFDVPRIVDLDKLAPVAKIVSYDVLYVVVFEVEFVVDLLVSNFVANTVVVLNNVLKTVEVPNNVEYVVEVLVKVNPEVPVDFEVPVKVLLLTSLVSKTGSPDTVVVISVLYVVVVETSFDV
jgi:hypothetical protein